MTHFSAWLTTDLSALAGRNADITVLPDEIAGYRDEDEQVPEWMSTGDPVFHAETVCDAVEGDIADAMGQAEELLAEAGWRPVGDWSAIDSGMIVTVEKV